ncbi:hypothetical protein ACJD0Z_12015 [Flavobacteriaceae bacterium M23B6Z8]
MDKIQTELIKKILFGILAFFVGIIIGLTTESFFRDLIQDIFRGATFHKIKFIGKNFYIFSNKFHVLSFGIAFLILTLENIQQEFYRALKRIVVSLLIFSITLVGISAMNAHLKLIECTACEDGILKLHWNAIN